ncbi:HTH_Tnp_Tc3_2 domain-containing protein [Trichonephila clavipes]|nr:HTH_Tnp_Tc3_2 domain-containing protein [Trichonephila clavipes]
MPSPVQSNCDAHDTIANGQYGAVWSMGHTQQVCVRIVLLPSNVWQQFFGRSAFLRQQETDLPPAEMWTVIRNAVLDLNGPLSLAAEKTRMAFMERAATSRALSQELGSFARQQVSVRTVRRRLLQHGLSSRRPWLRLALTLHQRQERLQWCDQRRNWCTNGEASFFSD